MEVQIQTLQSTVQAFDGDVPLSPQTMDKIVRAVLQAVNDQQAHRQRVRAEQRIMQRGESRARGKGLRAWNRSRKPFCALSGTRRNPEMIEVQYNPTELSWDKGAQIAEISIPGLDAPLQQFVRGQAEKLTLELFFDTTDHGMGKDAVQSRR